LPKQSKSVKAKRGENWNDPGPMRIRAQDLYIKYPLMSAADIARILGVSRQLVCKYVKKLTEERERAREEALVKLKREEGL
jgi:DNA-binding transcriptional regulator LsrR (DeoR family)